MSVYGVDPDDHDITNRSVSGIKFQKELDGIMDYEQAVKTKEYTDRIAELELHNKLLQDRLAAIRSFVVAQTPHEVLRTGQRPY